MVFDILRRDPNKLAYKRDVGVAYSQGEGGQPEKNEIEEYVQMMARVGYLTIDENVIKWLFDHPPFHALIAALAPVNRTTVLTPKQAEVNRLDVELLIGEMLLWMDPETYEAGAPELLQGFRIFANNIINDAVEGKKLQALTQVHKRVEIDTEGKKRGRFG